MTHQDSIGSPGRRPYATPALLFFLAAACCATATAQNPWNQLPGVLQRMSIGADGSVWGIGTGARANGNFSIHKWNGSDWDGIAGGAVRIAVDPTGVPWVITAQNTIWKYNPAARSFVQMPGGGSEISIGADGSVWLLGGTPTPAGTSGNNNSIYKWNGSSWDDSGGHAMLIAVEPLGTPWVITADGRQSRRNWDQRIGFNLVPSSNPILTTQIGIGANGAVWAIGAPDMGGGNHPIYQWNGAAFDTVAGTAVAVSVAPDGTPWVITATGVVFRGQPQDVPVALTVANVVPPPPAPPAQQAGSGDDICWKNTAVRGVGSIPGACPAGTAPDTTGALCYPVCQSGYNGIGPVCWNFPSSYGRGVGSIKNGCGIGREYDAGLCYGTCPANTAGVGPVCWGTCSGKYPVECGAACAVSDLQCAAATTNLVGSVLQSAMSIVGLIASGGASAGAVAAAKASGVGSGKAVGAAAVKAAITAALKAAVLQQAKEQGKDLADSEAQALAQQAALAYINGVSGGVPSFDPTSLDPTGISGVVVAYNKPICDGAPIAGKTPDINAINTIVFGIDSSNRLWANSGSAWYPFPKTGPTSNVSIALDGTLWRLDLTGMPSAWNGSGWTQYGTTPFTQISTAGKNNVWAVNSAGNVYHFDGRLFNKMRGAGLKQISAGADGTVWAADNSKTAMYWMPGNESWNLVNNGGLLSQFSVGSAMSVWALGYTGQVMRNIGSATWDLLPSAGNSNRQMAAGGSGEVWYLNNAGQPMRLVKLIGAGSGSVQADATLFDVVSFKQIAIR